MICVEGALHRVCTVFVTRNVYVVRHSNSTNLTPGRRGNHTVLDCLRDVVKTDVTAPAICTRHHTQGNRWPSEAWGSARFVRRLSKPVP